MIKRFLNFLKLTNNLSSNNLGIDLQLKKLLSSNLNKVKNVEKLEFRLFHNYFNSSDSLTEKKYKMAVLSLILEQHNVYLSEMPLIERIIKDSSQELLNNQDTSINLYDVFPVKDDAVFDTLDEHLIKFKKTGIKLISQILDEDKNNYEKMHIAKTIYNKFSFLGLLANTMISLKSHFDIYMQFQDSKFNYGDINVLKEFLKKEKDPLNRDYFFLNMSVNKWETFILNENDPDNLKLFKEIYIYDRGIDSDFEGHRDNDLLTREKDKEYLIELVQKRIDYVELYNSLDEQTQIHNKKNKRPKL